MRKFLLLLCIPFVGIAQTDHELAFTSTTLDYVEITNASNVIANKTAFSMSCWFYPEANTNHGGIIGFRNNTDADFYLLQMQNTNTIEARFRNSSNINYDIIATNSLDFNQWQHLAFTYDGSYIRLYKNGIIIDSTAANGTITQTTQSFNLGMLDYQGSAFHLNGRLDEIRLWDVALSPTEIIGWICSPIYLFHPNYNNLMGYWRLNEGSGTFITDLSVNANNGTLNNNPTWQVTTTCFGSTTPPLTYVPDNNFENYLEANGMGDGIALNDSVLTSNINTIAFLDVSNQNISELTGIEDFIALTDLDCWSNQLTSLDVSNNSALTKLYCQFNPLGSLDVSNNTALTDLVCVDNQLTSLNVSNNTALTELACQLNQLTSLDVSINTALTLLSLWSNQLTSLDVSANPDLTSLNCSSNQFTSLDVRNGNNINFTYFYAENNPNLFCIDVDDPVWSTVNWTVANGNIDSQHYFSNNCSSASFDCTDLLEVTDVIIDNTNLTMNIAIYNGYNYFLNYPYVAYTIDANGDTIQAGNMNLFGANNLVTTWYNYSLSNIISPAYPLTMYFVYSDGSLVTDTCILTYNSTPSAIIDFNVSSNRKLISIVDVLGRKNKGKKNEVLFYIYDDGVVEKKIIIE
jgi:hypothetical protein